MKSLPFFGIMLTRGAKLKKVISIAFVVLWMISLFSFSNQQGESSSFTSKKVSKIIVNIINIKNEYREEQIISNIEPYIRKLAHFSLYALGGILLMNAIRLFLLRENIQILTSSGMGILYAMIDEIHQLLIPRKKWENNRCFNRFIRNINRSYGIYSL